MEKINATSAPAAIGPYCHAVRSGSLVFTSGQIPVDPATGTLVEDDITATVEGITATAAGTGYKVGNVLTLAAAEASGSPAQAHR